jgi:glutathione S-transferase
LFSNGIDQGRRLVRTEPPPHGPTLYGYATSPYVWQVNCYLLYKRIDFTFVHVNPLTSEQIEFTGQGQVPVFDVGSDWFTDPASIVRWIDQRVAERPLLPNNELCSAIQQTDTWVTKRLMRGLFRQFVDWDRLIDSLRNGWTLAQIVHEGTALPPWVRVAWPVGLRRTDFIIKYANSMDRTQPLAVMRQELTDEFLRRLGNGPFLCESAVPTLADLSAFPVITAPQLLGLDGDSIFGQELRVRDWAARVARHLPPNPLPCADHFIKGSLEASE